MPAIEVLMPAMGEGIIEATLISWNKNVGDAVSIDEVLIEVATDKVNSEVPSSAKGILAKKLYNENDVIPVGKPFAILSTDGDLSNIETPAPQVEAPKVEEKAAIVEPAKVEAVKVPVSPADFIHTAPTSLGVEDQRFYSPLVLNIAKEEQISKAELASIPGTGLEGRVTKDDLMAYIKNRMQSSTTSQQVVSNHTSNPVVEQQVIATPNPVAKDAPKNYGDGVEVVPMDRMRKLIADHMVKSVHTSPHVCSFIEADVTNIVNWRNKTKNLFKEKYGENLTFTPIFIEAIARAIQDFPIINASLDGDQILLKKDINIGMAAALPDGNLIVPVIKNADQLNMIGLAKKVNELAKKAKANQLKPEDIQGGTYTMTNLGSFGNVFGTPIINQPQVAILGVGAIVKKPVVIETKDGDTIAVRSMMYLSHSYDHRVIDGMAGGSFVKRVAEYLEAFDVNRTI